MSCVDRFYAVVKKDIFLAEKAVKQFLFIFNDERGRKQLPAENEALGRSKGGFGCKIHAICDALGMPVKFSLTGGQEAECRQAIPLLENVNASAVLADKAYDTNSCGSG
jgi:hypothetical protein